MTDEEERPLFFLREGNVVQILLPRVPEKDSRVIVDLACEGNFFDRGTHGDWALRDGRGWYPRTGPNERATYDVTLRWPRGLELLASGQRVDHGESNDIRWERRRLEVPAFGFSFEVGHFQLKSVKVGHVKLTVGLDPYTLDQAPEGSLGDLVANAADALRYYEELFGAYPLDELTLVTVPRQYSQAMLGFVTLSGRVVVDWGVFGPLLRVQDRGSVVAHELAHQWWGHLVGWRSYRDQWISEAMANYAALLWARQSGWRPTQGPISGWQQELTSTIADGRPIESLGPMVLGERLFSSRSKDAYHAIVYRKGALVLEMLARKIGEERFLSALEVLVRETSGSVISTSDFLSLLERITGTRLDAFAQQFIFGTGLPEIYYDYSFEPAANGRWRVRLQAQQEIPARYRYEVVATADGHFDVARNRIEQPFEIDSSEVVVPFKIQLARDTETAARLARHRAPPTAAPERQQFLLGRLVIAGRQTDLDFEIDHRPSALWLDSEGEIFGRFLDRRHHPKRMLLNEAAKQAAAGRLELAADSLRRAVATRSPLASTDELLDTHLHLLLANVQLDAGRDGDAASSRDQARDALERDAAKLPHSEARRFASALEILEARIDIHRGEYDRAFRRLRSGVLDRTDVASTAGYLLLAIAAEATDRGLDLAAALEVARQRGADVSRLSSTSSHTRLSSVR